MTKAVMPTALSPVIDSSARLTPTWQAYFRAIEELSKIIQSGVGSPEGVVTAGVGTMYLRSDGGAGTTLYIKESGTSSTGWAGK